MIQSEKILKKYPDRIPIIVNRYKDSDIPNIDKNKFIVPKDMKMNAFIYIIRRRIKITSEQTIFVTVNKELCANNQTINEIYDKCKNEDGFLYVEYSGENTFG